MERSEAGGRAGRGAERYDGTRAYINAVIEFKSVAGTGTPMCRPAHCARGVAVS